VHSLNTHEANAKDYCKKIDQLNSQIGEYEGELNTLRLRCDSLEDEVSKLRALIAKYKDENARLRAVSVVFEMTLCVWGGGKGGSVVWGV